jgi:hypothetical protein
MILRRLELDEDQRALCAHIRHCLDKATAADPSLANYSEVALLELSDALASGPSGFDVVHWRRFFNSLLTITQELDEMPITLSQQLAMLQLVRLIDENRDLVDS